MKTPAEYQELLTSTFKLVSDGLKKKQITADELSQIFGATPVASSATTVGEKRLADSLRELLQDTDKEAKRIVNLAISLAIIAPLASGKDLVRQCLALEEPSEKVKEFYLTIYPTDKLKAMLPHFNLVLKYIKATTIRIDMAGFNALEPNHATALVNALIGSRITTVISEEVGARLRSSRVTTPFPWDETHVKLFTRELTYSQVKALDLRGNFLYAWDLARFQHFCDALSYFDSQLISLNLSNNKLGTDLVDPCFLALCTALKASKIEILNMAGNDLGAWDIGRITLFWDAVGSQLISLDLSNNKLDTNLDDPCFLALCTALKASKIETLGMAGNNLGAWNIVRFKLFCEALKASKVKILDLSSWSTTDTPWSDAHFIALGDFLKSSEITSLKLSYVEVTANGFTALTNAILSNPKITEIEGLPDNTPADLLQALQRNQALSTLCNRLNSFATTDEEINEIAKLDEDALETMVGDLDTATAAALEIWKTMQPPAAARAGCKMLQQAIAVFLKSLHKNVRGWQLGELLRELPSSNAAVRDLYFEYIRSEYLSEMNTLNKPGQPSNPAQGFTNALQFCFDAQQTPIAYSDGNQLVWDGFLHVAADVNMAPGESVSIEKRLTLLRYFILQRIEVAIQEAILKPQGAGQSRTIQTFQGVRNEIVQDRKTYTQDVLKRCDQNTQQHYAQLLDRVLMKLVQAKVDVTLLEEICPINKVCNLIAYWEDVRARRQSLDDWGKAQTLTPSTTELIAMLPHCVDQYGRLLHHPKYPIQRLDDWLLQETELILPKNNEPLSDAERLTLLQSLFISQQQKAAPPRAPGPGLFQPAPENTHRLHKREDLSRLAGELDTRYNMLANKALGQGQTPAQLQLAQTIQYLKGKHPLAPLPALIQASPAP